MIRGLYPGVWDLLHPGHLFALDWASKRCDHLTVALNIDPTIDNPEADIPIEPDLDRFVRLLCCKFVDNVIYYECEKELAGIYQSGYFNRVFYSETHKDTDIPYIRLPEKLHNQVVFVPYLSDHSTADYRHRLTKKSPRYLYAIVNDVTWDQQATGVFSAKDHEEAKKVARALAHSDLCLIFPENTYHWDEWENVDERTFVSYLKDKTGDIALRVRFWQQVKKE